MRARDVMRACAMALCATLFLAGSASAESTDAPARRAIAPSFRVRSLAAEKLELERLRAKGPVLLDFWATWCRPCVASLPEIEALHRRFAARGLTVIGVSIDGPRNFAKVRPFASRLGLTFPIVLDEDGSLQEGFRVLAAPTSILVARDGTILRVRQGFLPGESAALASAIEEALGPAPGDSSAAAPPGP